MGTKYAWAKLYRAAVLETDWLKIEPRIQAAEDAIKARLHEFSSNAGGTLDEENQQITKALNGLNILRIEVSAWRELHSNLPPDLGSQTELTHPEGSRHV